MAILIFYLILFALAIFAYVSAKKEKDAEATEKEQAQAQNEKPCYTVGQKILIKKPVKFWHEGETGLIIYIEPEKDTGRIYLVEFDQEYKKLKSFWLCKNEFEIRN